MGVLFSILGTCVTLYLLWKNPLIAIPGIMIFLGFVGPDIFGKEYKDTLGFIGMLGIFGFPIGGFLTLYMNYLKTGRFDLNGL